MPIPFNRAWYFKEKPEWLRGIHLPDDGAITSKPITDFLILMVQYIHLCKNCAYSCF